nr:penicillin acylase family protein [Salinispora arenicola]
MSHSLCMGRARRGPGAERFYRMHLKVPGRYEVEGVTLLGDPFIQIGHNGQIACDRIAR